MRGLGPAPYRTRLKGRLALYRLKAASMTSTAAILADDGDFEIVATRLPPHPGEILREEFLAPLGLTVGKLAKACHIPRSCLEQLAAETLGVSGDTALRLGRVFGTGPELWMNLQAGYELAKARAAAGDEIDALEPLDRAT